MALKNITSSDPRKANIVANLRTASGLRSVTVVKHDTVNKLFSGHCFNRGFDANNEAAGTYVVNEEGVLVKFTPDQAAQKAPGSESA